MQYCIDVNVSEMTQLSGELTSDSVVIECMETKSHGVLRPKKIKNTKIHGLHCTYMYASGRQQVSSCTFVFLPAENRDFSSKPWFCPCTLNIDSKMGSFEVLKFYMSGRA